MTESCQRAFLVGVSGGCSASRPTCAKASQQPKQPPRHKRGILTSLDSSTWTNRQNATVTKESSISSVQRRQCQTEPSLGFWNTGHGPVWSEQPTVSSRGKTNVDTSRVQKQRRKSYSSLWNIPLEFWKTMKYDQTHIILCFWDICHNQ